MRRTGAVIALTLGIWVSAAEAQMSFQPNWAGWGAANIGGPKIAPNRPAPSRSTGETRSALPPSLAPTTYRRDPAVTRKVEAQYVAYAERTVGAQKAALLRADLDRRDFARVWAIVAGQDGFSPGDAADALAAYWTLNWAMANNQDITARQAAGARAQIAATAPRALRFDRLGDAGRQELAETFMLDFIYQQGPYVDALKRRDQATTRTLSDAAETRFRQKMHIDLRSLNLTDHGFQPRS